MYIIMYIRARKADELDLAAEDQPLGGQGEREASLQVPGSSRVASVAPWCAQLA